MKALNEYITESKINVNGLWAICQAARHALDRVVGIAEGKDEMEACANYLFDEDMSACIYAVPLSKFLVKNKSACVFNNSVYDIAALGKWEEIGEDFDRMDELQQLAKKINKW